ncbi:putative nudix hydrolase 8 [Cocos nucifera]|uniref:Putative nudix hydrolase 8 n=1 Tax=Cocos nucifera TaxID=13894 RepID=A0A8K0IFB1_COCNU|nr:putative nudix hydrolase 8 [Cocos nucifera]
MEKVLFDSKLELAFLGRRTCSKPSISPRGDLRFSGQACSVRQRGFRGNVSYSIARTSTEDIDSIAPKKLLTSDSCIIHGSKVAACLWPSPTENYELDAYEDEYGGIIIKSEGLPWNANIFASALRQSLSHWKVEVFEGSRPSI